MRSIKALELLNEGRIEDLKRLLEDELYEEAIKSKPGAKKRYSAMKKYCRYINSAREILQKPCPVEFEGTQYISYCNSYSLALTTESSGELALCEEPDRYPDVTRLIRADGPPWKVDLNKVIAEAKSKGYKLTKTEVNGAPCKFMMHYDGAYFRLGLLDATYSIIDNGEPVTVYHKKGNVSPILIENELGKCLILPMKCDEEFINSNFVTIIEAEVMAY